MVERCSAITEIAANVELNFNALSNVKIKRRPPYNGTKVFSKFDSAKVFGFFCQTLFN
jgi:hypothetical protein